MYKNVKSVQTYFLYENIVYVKDDDTKFLENHYEISKVTFNMRFM